MTDPPSKSRSNIVFAFVVALGLYVAWILRDVLLLLYVSALLAVVSQPVVNSVEQFRVGKYHPFSKVAVLVLLLAVVGVLVAFGALALPPVIADLQTFSKEAPARVPLILEKLHRIPFAGRINASDVSARLQDIASSSAKEVIISFTSLTGKLFTIVMGIVLTIYFIEEGDTAYRWFLSFFPDHSRRRLNVTLQRSEARMGRWLLGQLSLMVILWVASTVTFLLLHVRYAYALGALSGLLNVIPILGAAISIALALIVAAVDSWGRVVGVAVFYLIYQQIENSILTPRIMQKRVGLPGLAILVSLLLGTELAGIVGALVSVPTAVLVTELVNEYLVTKDGA
ncbi:MAG: AI-2E family transporter [Terracidiphilus sp.]